MKNKLYVITGGPGVGKTTSLDILKGLEYNVLDETARKIIEHELKNGSKPPWTDFERFEKEIYKIQFGLESRLPSDRVTFLDRSLIGNLAYYRLQNIEPPSELIEAARQSCYAKIFLLDPLNIYENDQARQEDSQTAKKIHELVARTYTELGYELIRVPVMQTKKDRAEYILNKVGAN